IGACCASATTSTRLRCSASSASCCCPSTSASSVLGLGQLAAQLEHGLGVHLADAALGHPEDLTDLGEREAFVVVERHDDLLPLGQRVDRTRKQVLRLLGLEDRNRVLGLGVFERVDERELVATLPTNVEQFVERDHVDEGHLREDRVQLLERDPELA